MEQPEPPGAAASGGPEDAGPPPPGPGSGGETQSAPPEGPHANAGTQAASPAAAVAGPLSTGSPPQGVQAAESGSSDGASAAQQKACGADTQHSQPQQPPQQSQSQSEGEWQRPRSRRRQQHLRPAAERFADCASAPAPSPVHTDGSSPESRPSPAELPADDGGSRAATYAAAVIGRAASDAAAAAPASAAGRGSALVDAAASRVQPAGQPRERTWAALAEGGPPHGPPQQPPRIRRSHHDQHGPTHPGRQQRQPGTGVTTDSRGSASGRQGRAGTPAAVETSNAAAAPAAAPLGAGRSGEHQGSASRTGRFASQTAKSPSQTPSQTTMEKSLQRVQPGKAPRDHQAAGWQASEAAGILRAGVALPLQLQQQDIQAWPPLVVSPDWLEVRPCLSRVVFRTWVPQPPTPPASERRAMQQ